MVELLMTVGLEERRHVCPASRWFEVERKGVRHEVQASQVRHGDLIRLGNNWLAVEHVTRLCTLQPA